MGQSILRNNIEIKSDSLKENHAECCSAKMGLKMALCNAQCQILPVFYPMDLLITIATKVNQPEDKLVNPTSVQCINGQKGTLLSLHENALLFLWHT